LELMIIRLAGRHQRPREEYILAITAPTVALTVTAAMQ
jgi:hypothetical protein